MNRVSNCDSRNVVIQNRIIQRGEKQAVLERLADQHPVERVLVKGWQGGEPGDARFIKRKGNDPVPFSLAWKVGIWGFRQGKFP